MAGGALDRDAAVVRDRDCLDQAEAEAEAPFGAARIHAKQPIPDSGDGVGGDASAGVANTNLGLADVAATSISTRPPRGVYLTALSTRFAKAWRIRVPSASSSPGHPAASDSVTPASSATCS